MADEEFVWMNNTGTGPVAVPTREVEGKLRIGWLRIEDPKVTPKPKLKPKKE